MEYTGERTVTVKTTYATIEINPWDVIDFWEQDIIKIERDWEVIDEIEWDITSLKFIN